MDYGKELEIASKAHDDFNAAIKTLSKDGQQFAYHTMRWGLEISEKWREWGEEIPEIKFPSHWGIKIIPPFSGAMARFTVHINGEQMASVYLDCYNQLGYYDEPYWELYPYKDDTFRCAMKDTDALLKAIHETIEDRIKNG